MYLIKNKNADANVDITKTVSDLEKICVLLFNNSRNPIIRNNVHANNDFNCISEDITKFEKYIKNIVHANETFVSWFCLTDSIIRNTRIKENECPEAFALWDLLFSVAKENETFCKSIIKRPSSDN